MSGPRLPVLPLSRDSFAPFGDVIELGSATPLLINERTTERFDDLARVEVGEGQAKISLFRGQPRPAPIRIAMLERHPLGSQAFVPLDGRPYLVVVAAEPTPDALRAFRAKGHQGVNYHRNVWHHPLLVLQPDSLFLVVDRAGDGDNLEEAWLAEGDRAFIELA